MAELVDNGWHCGCGEFNPEVFENCRACEVSRNERKRDIRAGVSEVGYGAGDVHPVLTAYEQDHPWAKQCTLPAGLFSPQKNKVVGRSLKLVTTGTVVLPQKAHRAAGWFIIGFPGSLEDQDQRCSQEMVIEGGKTADGESLEILVQPGDIIAASDFQCWPVDLYDAGGNQDRWRLVPADDVIVIIKPGTPAYADIIRKYEPFTTESDKDLNA